MNKLDFVSPEIRNVEKEIDKFYLTNPLLNENFGYAAWFYSAFCEDTIARDALSLNNSNIHHSKYETENHTEALKYGIKWLYDNCSKNGEIIRKYNDSHYGFSKELYELAINYHLFSVILTYASRGLVELELKLNDKTIFAKRPLFLSSEYEAFSRLTQENPSDKFNFQDYPINPSDISLRFKDDRFFYSYNTSTILKIKEFYSEFNNGRFQLPYDWSFSKFDLKDFKEFYETIFCMCILRFNARLLAEKYWFNKIGKLGLGFADSIIVKEINELIKQIVKYSDLDREKVESIVSYLTYGSKSIQNTEPAIQPFIKLRNDELAIIPSLIISTAAERNLTVLFNKLPHEREIYLRLVNEKEDIMIDNLKNEIQYLNVRFESRILLKNNLPDIDCAIIDDDNRIGCIIELKWFIDPAEVREIIEKSEELTHGIDQLIELKDQIESGNTYILERLNITSKYKIFYLLISANWIGYGDVQHDDVPILSEKLFHRKLRSFNSLNILLNWIKARSYLPKENVHYEFVDINTKIGDWSFNWFGIKPLINDIFNPN